jgi:hypothetical protein
MSPALPPATDTTREYVPGFAIFLLLISTFALGVRLTARCLRKVNGATAGPGIDDAVLVVGWVR